MVPEKVKRLHIMDASLEISSAVALEENAVATADTFATATAGTAKRMI